jgi:hypothetical protein
VAAAFTALAVWTIGFANPSSAAIHAAQSARPVSFAEPQNVASGSDPPGYWLLGGDGGVFTFSTPFFGSAASDPGRCPANPPQHFMPDGSCWSFAATPDGLGYWILDAYNGKIYTYGDAVSYGDPSSSPPYAGVPSELWPNAVGIVSTPDGKGYWVLLVGASGLGQVLHFGDAVYYGDELSQNSPHNGTPVAMAASRDGKGYWIVDSDGGVFTYGDAGFFGSMGGKRLNKAVVGLAATGDGSGYWLAAADGGVFSFGDADFGGSLATMRLNAPVVGMAADPSGPGYWLAAGDGGVFAFGGAPFLGSMGGKPLAQPVFAIEAGTRTA